MRRKEVPHLTSAPTLSADYCAPKGSSIRPSVRGRALFNKKGTLRAGSPARSPRAAPRGLRGVLARWLLGLVGEDVAEQVPGLALEALQAHRLDRVEVGR